MTELLTAAQMRAIEGAAIASGAVTGLALMETAGQGVVEAIFNTWPDLQVVPGHAVVLCGPGNNGGDGFVVTRLLARRGWQVTTWLYGATGALPPDARTSYDAWCEIGGVRIFAIDPARPQDDVRHLPERVDLLVDGLFGTGLTRPVSEAVTGLVAADIQARLVARGTRRVAIDIPSGLCSDSGRVLGSALPADLTVSFHRAKLGHVLDRGPALSGRLAVADIGIEGWTGQGGLGPTVRGPARAAGPSRLGKERDGHKYSHGHALVLTGGFGATGAARLAARAALRIGAGLVTLGVPGSAQLEVACHITVEMMTRIDTPDALRACLADPRLTALCVGPGLGLSRARDLVPAALEGMAAEPGSHRAVILDADALSAFEDRPDALFEKLTPRCVLTPHAGEFRRLFPDLAQDLAAPATTGPAVSKVDATRRAAARAGCVVLLKGPDTVMADPEGAVVVHAAMGARAVPWLATAGAGDVLAGLICGLLARGFAPLQAAETAAWLHVEAARRAGPGLIAEDLAARLPEVLMALETQAGSEPAP